MKILALMGSPRKGGNTDILIDQILLGGREKGHFGEKLYLYDYDTLPCIDCRRCKKDLPCPHQDGASHIFQKMEEADALIFGTPIYWYGPTAKMKLLIDRLRPYIATGKLSGKIGAIAVPSEEGPACCGPLEEMFKMSFQYLGISFAGAVLATAYEKGEVAKRLDDLKKAYELGKAL
jgi:multimeric flavodoxin WrbA